MFKIKIQKKPQEWKVFDMTKESDLKIGNIIKVKGSTGTYKVYKVGKKEIGSYYVLLQLIIPRPFGDNRSLELFSGDEYRIIGQQ